MRVLRLLVLASLVVASACSSGPSLTEYAGEVEALVTTMNARIDQLDGEVEREQSWDGVRNYAQERVEARSEFLASLRALDPPDEAADLHEVAVGIIERLTAAEAALADRVMAMESTDDIGSIWSTPEGIAARTADEKTIELCLAAQSEFDDTADRSELSEVPWIPSEMKEVVVVVFGCIAADR